MHAPQSSIARLVTLRGTVEETDQKRCVGAEIEQHILVRVVASVTVCLLAGLGVGFLCFHGPPPLTPAAAAALRQQEMITNAAAWPDSPAATDAKAQRLMAVC